MIRILTALGALTLSLSGLLAAQEPTATVTAGRMVRIKETGGQTFQGNLLSANTDTVSLVRPGLDTVRILRGAVERFEVYTGEGHNVGRSTVKGTIIGGGIGLVLGLISAAAYAGDDDAFSDVSAGAAIGAGLLEGVILGAGIGAIVGLIDKSPTWEKIPLPSVAVTGGQGGAGAVRLGLNLRF